LPYGDQDGYQDAYEDEHTGEGDAHADADPGVSHCNKDPHAEEGS
jgi:hypothetical protein